MWWLYKAWRFFKQKEELDIMPAARALFSIFFLHNLLTMILDYSNKHGYSKTYSTSGMFWGFIILNFTARLPEPFWLLSLFSFIFLIPPFKALNYAKQSSTEFIVKEQSSFSGRQIVLIMVGAIFWTLVIIGFAATR
jgi:hypothetical protein